MSNYFFSLREFISLLEKQGELVKINQAVSPILEITEITDRVSKSADGGKALLFENVEGSPWPLLINAYGSKKRMNLALGVKDIEEIPARIDSLLHQKPPKSLMDKIGVLKTILDARNYIPGKYRGSAPCQEVVLTGDAIDLFKVPVLQCWPGDAGRFITYPAVFTKSMKSGLRNVGLYRMQVFDKKTTGMHWHIHKDGAAHFDEYKRAGKKMEVAVAIGTDPAVTYAATAPLPPDLDELLLAGFIRNKGVELVQCKTIDMEVPATAEIVLEGFIDPSETRVEGPFGDHTGYYSLKGEYPVFHVTAITHRKNPVYFTTIVGKPPMEDCYIGKATERIFLPLLKMVTPEITDMTLPWEGVFHNCVIVSMKKRFPMHSRKLMSALWGAGQMSFAKMILLVDSETNLQNHGDIARHALNTVDIHSDLVITEGVLDVLDHSAPESLFGGKLGIDATTRMGGEPTRFVKEKAVEEKNPSLSEFQQVSSRITAFYVPFTDVVNRVLFLSIKKEKEPALKSFGSTAFQKAVFSPYTIVCFFDAFEDIKNTSVALWRVFNNVDPRRDLLLNETHLIVDATKKIREEGYQREWPDDILMTEDVIKKIDRLVEEGRFEL
ncbi:MAG: menaquinone biosynthesis decarboxylase [Nitrospinota bacterium]